MQYLRTELISMINTKKRNVNSKKIYTFMVIYIGIIISE